MYTIQLHRRINNLMEVLRKVRLWHSGDQATATETRIKLFYSIYLLLFLISLIAGGCTSDNRHESIHLILTAAIVLVAFTRLLHLVWKRNDIVELLHRICVHYVDDEGQLAIVNEKLDAFVKFAVVLACSNLLLNICCGIGVPLLGAERNQVFNVGFPFDWRTNDVVYWIEFVFIFIGVLLASSTLLFSILTWYLYLNLVLKYDVLASRLRNLGVVSERQKDNLFVRGVIAAIETHKDIIEYFR